MKQMVFISFCVKLTLYLLCSMKLLSSFCLKPPYELSWQHVARNYCTDALPYKDSIQCLFLQKKIESYSCRIIPSYVLHFSAHMY